MTIAIDERLEDVDWARLKTDLTADEFDNGRSPAALRRSFERSQHVAIARDGDRVVGTARLLSDGVCNAYLVDVWTAAAYRRRGYARSSSGRTTSPKNIRLSSSPGTNGAWMGNRTRLTASRVVARCPRRRASRCPPEIAAANRSCCPSTL